MAQKIMYFSSLSSFDFANICAHYYGALTDEQDDEKILLKRGFPKEYIEKTLKSKRPKHYEVMGLKYAVPLTRFKYPLMNYVLTLFENYEKGNLPFPGTITEQPAQIMEIFSTIRAIRFEYQAALEKENKNQSKRK